MILPGEGDFDGAYVCGSLIFVFSVLRKETVCADADAFDFHIGKEPVPHDFSDVDGSADGFAACFDADFFSSAVEEGDASEDIVHYWFFADQDRVGVFCHGCASLLVYFLVAWIKLFIKINTLWCSL